MTAAMRERASCSTRSATRPKKDSATSTALPLGRLRVAQRACSSSDKALSLGYEMTFARVSCKAARRGLKRSPVPSRPGSRTRSATRYFHPALGIICPPPDDPQETCYGNQGRRPASRRQADGVHGIRFGHAVRHAAQGSERRRRRARQEDRDLRPARSVHPHLLGEARAGLRAERRGAEEEGGARDLVRRDQRRLRHGALGPRPEGARQDPLPGRRKRRLDQGARPGARPQRARHGHAHESLLDAGRQRGGEAAERGGAREVRGFRRRHDAEAGRLKRKSARLSARTRVARCRARLAPGPSGPPAGPPTTRPKGPPMLRTLLPAVMLAFCTPVFAQAPSDAPKPKGERRFDCSKAKDPKACEERLAKAKAARDKANKACEGKKGDERRDCMSHEMC